ncbi:porin family protein [Rufibacter roseus]|uniref:Porin family protein n=1 Tax=Rufibacter roseus TaxID=1567108 RepID=A0ABW2DEC4_9BACT|nr:porin family protein [Rufibacter roseus]
MKKNVLFLALAAALSFSVAQAQTGPRIGLKAGVTYSNLAGNLENEDIYKNRLGFVGGLTANLPLAADGFLSIQPELLYTQKGYTYRDQAFTLGTENITRQGDVIFNYVELPVFLRVNTGVLYFEAGPQVSYLVHITNESEERIGNSSFEQSNRINKDNMAEFEIGYGAGLGLQTPGGFNLNLRYNGSINSLAKENNDELTNGRHSAFLLTIGYMFPGR